MEDDTRSLTCRELTNGDGSSRSVTNRHQFGDPLAGKKLIKNGYCRCLLCVTAFIICYYSQSHYQDSTWPARLQADILLQNIHPRSLSPIYTFHFFHLLNTLVHSHLTDIGGQLPVDYKIKKDLQVFSKYRIQNNVPVWNPVNLLIMAITHGTLNG